MVTSSEVDERTLREIYALPFEIVIRHPEPWTAMSAYNRVNGTHMTQHEALLTGVLTGEWGFGGLIVSDRGAVANKVGSVRAGLDLERPGPGKRDEKLLAAVDRGDVTIEEIDDRARRVLRLVEHVGESKRVVPHVAVDAHHDLAVRVSTQSMVLLKNDDALLPA